MPRRRTGSLRQVEINGALIWHAQITVGPKGASKREWVSFGTTDEVIARRRLKQRLLEDLRANATADAPPPTSTTTDTLTDYAEKWIEARAERGVAMVPSERGYLDRHVLPVLGAKPLGEIRSGDVFRLLEAVAAKRLASGKKPSRETVTKIRATLSRVMDHAWRAELITENPVARVAVPEVDETKKDRCILADPELAALLGCPTVDFELKMLSIVARVEGGMRSGDLNRWDWSMLDAAAGFSSCIVPRAKTRKKRAPQQLDIPPMLRPFLNDWWERAGKPLSGPVFPVRKGERAGQFKRPTSYAKRLRRALRKALAWAGIPERRELFAETEYSLPVDFHSFRRGFKTALAEAGVTTERAMHLSGSTDPRVHAGYVMRTTAMRAIPEAALPQLGSSLRTEEVLDVEAEDESVEHTAACSAALADDADARAHYDAVNCNGECKRNQVPPSDPNQLCMFTGESERETGFEPATLSLGSAETSVIACSYDACAPCPSYRGARETRCSVMGSGETGGIASEVGGSQPRRSDDSETHQPGIANGSVADVADHVAFGVAGLLLAFPALSRSFVGFAARAA